MRVGKILQKMINMFLKIFTNMPKMVWVDTTLKNI